MPLFDGAVMTTSFGIDIGAGAESADAGVSMATDAVDDVGEATAAAIWTKIVFVDNLLLQV